MQHAPWDRLDTRSLSDIDAVCSALTRFRPDPILQVPAAGAHASAVLVPLYVANDEPHVLLTRRSSTLSTHAGQIAFPGGRLEPGETSIQAALRETHEEIGVDARHAHVVAELTAHRTISSTSHIVPHVVRLQSRRGRTAGQGQAGGWAGRGGGGQGWQWRRGSPLCLCRLDAAQAAGQRSTSTSCLS